MKILLVEDDAQLTTLLVKALTAHHYKVDAVADGQTAWELMQSHDYDLLLLDVMVPGLDGVNLCRKLRAAGHMVPVLLLTAKDEVGDRLAGLEAGADDYLVKPFDWSELLARIRALLRRGTALLPNRLTWENLQLNLDTGEIYYGETLLHLTPKEHGLLELFLRHPQRIFSRSALLDRIWPVDEFPGEAAVTTQVKGLRQKLKAAGLTRDPIETIYGLGYCLRAAPTQQAPPDPAPPPPEPAATAKVLAVVAKVREALKDDLADRIGGFERVSEQLAAGRLDPVQLQEAQAEAHRLIGSLGSLGLPEGSTIARQIETLLAADPLSPAAADPLAQLTTRLQQQVALSPAPAAPAAPVTPPAASLPTLLIIDDDSISTQQLAAAAGQWNLCAEVAADLATARRQIAARPPDIILLDLNFPDSQEHGFTFLAEFVAQHPQIPVVVFTAQNRLSDRIAATRLGGRCFLHKPIAPEQVFEAVTQVLHPTQVIDARVLIVDHDPQLLFQLHALLEPWGFQVSILQEAERFWEVLEHVIPDLLILEVELPGFSGVELCQVVRSDPRWSQMPILFLSAQTDTETVYRVFSVGADDYVTKPVVGPELIARILNRLERVQFLRKLAETQGRTPQAHSIGESVSHTSP